MQLQCYSCQDTFDPQEIRYRCHCGSLLAVQHQETAATGPSTFDARIGSQEVHDRSGVWRFRERILGLLFG